MSEYTPLQRLAVGHYLSKRLEAELRRGAGGLRDEVDADMQAAYEADGTSRRTITVNGTDCGALSAYLEPARERVIEKRLEVEDQAAFAAWVAENPEAVAVWLGDDPDAAESLAGWALVATGEQPAGTRWVERVRQYERPAQIKTRLTVKPDKLEDALPELRAGVLGELGAGHGDAL